jgi:hypothetical protein
MKTKEQFLDLLDDHKRLWGFMIVRVTPQQPQVGKMKNVVL